MAIDRASEMADQAASGPFVSLLCDTGNHDLCSGHGCDCSCHVCIDDEDQDYPFDDEAT